jgi:hypothetical protein
MESTYANIAARDSTVVTCGFFVFLTVFHFLSISAPLGHRMRRFLDVVVFGSKGSTEVIVRHAQVVFLGNS